MIFDHNFDNQCFSKIMIVGFIDSKKSSDLHSYLARCPSPKEIIVNSRGGDSKASIEIGDVIRENNIKLVINGICASSCASFVFMAAKKVEIAGTSLVLFHHTQSALLEAFESLSPDAKLDWNRMRISARYESEAYIRWNIDQEWLYYPLTKIKPACFYVVIDPEETNSVPGVPKYRAKYIAWMPSVFAFSSKEIIGNWRNEKTPMPNSATQEDRENIHKIIFGGQLEQNKNDSYQICN